MQQMPEQEYECPNCNDRLKVRHLGAPICAKSGCCWCDMVPVIQLYRPQADSPLLGCAMLPIILVVGFAILAFLYQIIKEVLS